MAVAAPRSIRSIRSARGALAGVVVGALVAGCGASDTVPSATAAATTASVDTTSPSTVAETNPSTTSPATTAPASTVPPPTTTEPARTTTPPATMAPAPASTTADPPSASAPTTAFAVTGIALVEIDVATGRVIRTIDEFFSADGLFRYSIQRAPDGTTMWFGESYEDGWYSCESSAGAVGRIDLASGAVISQWEGAAPSPSADGASLAYTATAVCVPDPQNEEFWVLTPADRVVLRDLESGTEVVIVSEPAPDTYVSPTAVEWVGFADDGSLLVLTADGSLRSVDPTASSTLQDHPVVAESLLGFPLGVVAAGLVTVDLGDEGSTDVFVVDLASGAATPLATSETFMAVGISDTGQLVAASSTPVTVHAEGLVTVLDVEGDPFVAELDW